MTDPGYTPTEMMIIAAARALAGVRTVFVGVGMPNVACNLARLTVAPELELVYESGVYGARPARLPLSIGDPTLVTGATSVVSMADLFGLYLQGGHIDVAFLGGAQVDRFGNLNTTVIGEYERPKVRLPGSGGAAEIAINARRVFHLVRLNQRSFVRRLDFVTSPGHTPGSGRQPSLERGGPELVVTDMALFDFDNPDREMQLASLHPGVTANQVQAGVGWALRASKQVGETRAPSEHELRLLREELDPTGLYRQ
ncbi:MAG TPA: CoA-transferase [Candidatus Dormibacteraeota bacterium]|nr:CoA-transferase [Candidatus Dormibacteraeota bacterium]